MYAKDEHMHFLCNIVRHKNLRPNISRITDEMVRQKVCKLVLPDCAQYSKECRQTLSTIN